MAEFIQILLEAVKGAIMITGLVIIMMLLIEYLNIDNHGKWLHSIKNSPAKQVLTGTILGAIPGCVGGFAAVSLYSHSVLGIGALIATMIVSTGDEAFLLLAASPGMYLKLLVILSTIAIAMGLCVNLITRRHDSLHGRNKSFNCKSLEIHSTEDNKVASIFRLNSYKTLQNPGSKRIIVMAGILCFIVLMATGIIGEAAEDNSAVSSIFNEKWILACFGGLAFITLLMTATANEHFIKEHIWNHILKKHLAVVLLWTLAALIICGIIINYMHTATLISKYSNYMPLLILIAAAIGLIPQSGPHIIFILLYLQGSLPLCVLITNAITQQGHVSLPLLAESKKNWILTKGLCALMGISAGLICYLYNL